MAVNQMPGSGGYVMEHGVITLAVIREPILLNYAPPRRCRPWKTIYFLILIETVLLFVGGFVDWRSCRSPMWTGIRSYDNVIAVVAYLLAFFTMVGTAVGVTRILAQAKVATRCWCLGLLGASAILFGTAMRLSLAEY